MHKNYMTTQGWQKMRDEYQRLNSVERPEIVSMVAWAASNGDRSENGDYIYGKKRLREIDRRMGFLESQLQAAEVIDPEKRPKTDTVYFGATVTIAREDDSREVYKIVGREESDPDQGKISYVSPIAKAIIGKKEGEEVLLRTPKGEEYIEIEKVEYVRID